MDGCPRDDVTTDLVFPVLFGVASDETAARIVRRLSAADFWTPAGLRVVPREAPRYSPDHESGLMGGVWVGVTFWFAFAAARFSPEFMDHGLSTSFENYSRDPRRNNTVPGQFSEWLHGETLVNQGMMLSPWFPPRYLWAAIEGAGGLDLSCGDARIDPLLAPGWKWLAVQRLPYRGRQITWLVARVPEPQVYTTYRAEQSPEHCTYEKEATSQLQVEGDAVTALALRRRVDLLLFAGNDGERTVTTRLRYDHNLAGSFSLRCFDSLRGKWSKREHVDAAVVHAGFTLEIERKGFCLLELTGE